MDFGKLFELFTVFFRIGGFTFGGGYAMIPLIQKETAEKRHWVTDETILDIIAIAESTPGPIAVNSATFIGYETAGTLGAACATFGVVLPSFLIILAISNILPLFESNMYVRYAFFGIRAGVLALVLKAMLNMYKQNEKDIISLLIMSCAFAAVVFLKVNTIYVVIACALFGIVTSLINGKKVAK